ncbi:MAG: folylpolyglutamate synthase/dihydrofolate synthase family protein [Candidatus Bipolaricaulota bacterium]|nr:folylpolyglutamate synthase/dihydrofolate synthase family protein [Candidatus Bipolaricaulota bacterium]
MDYSKALSILTGLPALEVKPGLARITRLIDILGHPEEKFAAVHIAGTNGKGSVAAMLASIFGHAGYRVGVFTSPEVIDFRDRIRIGEEWIGEQELADTVEEIVPFLERGEDHPTLFEALTGIALRHFAINAVDLAVVEVGLGGRFDATNVVRPVLSILTNVDRDHLGILGDTLEKIAWEKVGISRASVPFLAGPLSPGAARVVRGECQRVGAPLLSCDPGLIVPDGFEWGGVTYKVQRKGFPSILELPLLGGYQRDNLAIVLEAVLILRDRGFSLSNSAIQRGLAAVRWPGRFEPLGDKPRIVLDGAHNLPAIRAVAEDMQRIVPEKGRRHLLFGVLTDKEVEPMCASLFPHFCSITVTQSTSPRALPVGQLAQVAARLGNVVTTANSVQEGLSIARLRLENEDVLLVTGSITVVKEARPCLVGSS